MINGFNPGPQPANRGFQPNRGFNPGYQHRPEFHHQPQFRPQPPRFNPGFQQPIYRPMPMPMPYQQPMYNPYPSYGYPQYGQGPVAQFFHGAGERLQEVFQYVLHPFNAYARRMPYDAYMPRTQAQNLGRWLVNGGLIAGAFMVGSALLGGGGLSLGGLGAGIGLG